MKFNLIYFLFLIIAIFQLIFYQIYKLNVNDANNCLAKFKSNNLLGLIIFVNLLIGKLV